MMVTINNFKTLKVLEDFEFKPLSLITGVNSSGKSSFVQYLLLIKQSLAKKTTESSLTFDGNLINLGSFSEIIYANDLRNELTVEFSFDRTECVFPDISPLKIEKCDVLISFANFNNETLVNEIQFKYLIPDTNKKEQFLKFSRKGEKYEMTANTGLFNNDFFIIPASEQKESLEGEILFSSFFPRLFTTMIVNPDYEEEGEGLKDGLKNELDELIEKTKSEPIKQHSIEPNTKNVEEFITQWFQDVSYIGPLREQPKDFYPPGVKSGGIGNRGEYAAYLLETEGNNPISYFRIELNSDGEISFVEKEESLLSAVNYWICEVFELAKKISSIERQENYQVIVENNYGFESTIKHVGFGISQVLPIILEGLRMSRNSLLILEQPEIHLHPKIQGLLFDFFYSLVEKGKRLLIETHSDHLLVRLRRRVAEDRDEQLLPKINLEFVEVGEAYHYFEPVVLTDLGSVKEFPHNFIEQQEDYRAIVKAQAKKKLKNDE